MNPTLQSLIGEFHRKNGQKQLLHNELLLKQGELLALELLQGDLTDESSLLQVSSQAAQQSIKSVIEETVTQGLRSIWSDREYRFTVTIDQERGATVAEFHLEESIGGVWKERDFKSVGGGVCDVVSVLLRICGIILRRPSQRRFLVLDEPFKMMKEDKHETASRFLLKIAKELDIQIIMVTHSNLAAAHAEEVWKAVLEEGVCRLTKQDKPETGVNGNAITGQ